MSQVPLFANLSEYNLTPRPPVTRAGEVDAESDESVPLEELLDWDGTISCPFEDQFFIQVPFLQNKENLLAGISEEEVPDLASATVVKKFYMEMHADDLRLRYVVTMVTGAAYYRENPEFDYLDKPNYTGVVLLSSIQGKLIDATLYSDGLIRNVRLLTPEELASGEHEELHYITLYTSIPATKARQEQKEGDIAIEAVIDLDPAYKEDSYQKYYDRLLEEWMRSEMEFILSDGGGPIETCDGSDGGGNANANDNGGSSDRPHWREKEYFVSLSTNVPDLVQYYGTGSYAYGTRISVRPVYVGNPHFGLSAWFSHRTGDLADYKEMELDIRIDKDTKATAYFNDAPPCKDNVRGIMNPLRSMSVAATALGYYGGTYGYTRIDKQGKKQYHSGIDLLAEVGTPVYAMFSGKIGKIVSDVPDLPGQRPKLGNEIEIKAEYDGASITVIYGHLQSGNTVAINPRTGELFKKGDPVYAGDIIGYSGRSGNAYANDVPNKHVHLTVKKNGVTADPEDYINGTILGNTKKEINDNQGKKTDIRCD